MMDYRIQNTEYRIQKGTPDIPVIAEIAVDKQCQVASRPNIN
jgi:hypothetical protein